MPAAYELVGSEHSPPVHQQISKDEKDWPTQQDLAALRDSLERKESELQAAQERLNDQQRLLTAKIAHWVSAATAAQPPRRSSLHNNGNDHVQCAGRASTSPQTFMTLLVS